MENQSLDEHCSEGSDITSEVCNDNNNSTDQASPVRQFTTANCEEQNEEPECVKRWAVEFQERLKKQEAEERKQIAQLEEQGINVGLVIAHLLYFRVDSDNVAVG